MKDELIRFDVAKLAKEKGFNLVENCDFGFSPDGRELEVGFWRLNRNNEKSILRPTQSLLQRWLREVHNIHVSSDLNSSNPTNVNFVYCVTTNYNDWNSDDYSNHTSTELFGKYEDALEEGLKKGLKLIK